MHPDLRNTKSRVCEGFICGNGRTFKSKQSHTAACDKARLRKPGSDELTTSSSTLSWATTSHPRASARALSSQLQRSRQKTSPVRRCESPFFLLTSKHPSNLAGVAQLAQLDANTTRACAYIYATNLAPTQWYKPPQCLNSRGWTLKASQRLLDQARSYGASITHNED